MVAKLRASLREGWGPPLSRLQRAWSVSAFRSVASVLYLPGSTFRQIIARPTPWPALLTTVCTTSASAYVLYCRRNYNPILADAIARGDLSMDDATVSLAKELLVTWTMLGFVLAQLGLWLLVSASVELLSRGLRFEIDRRATYSVAAYAQIPLALGNMAVLAMWVVGSNAIPSLDGSHERLPWTALALMPMVEAPLARRVLAGIDVFTCWQFALGMIGYAHLLRRVRTSPPSSGGLTAHRRISALALIAVVYFVAASLHWFAVP